MIDISIDQLSLSSVYINDISHTCDDYHYDGYWSDDVPHLVVIDD